MKKRLYEIHKTMLLAALIVPAAMMTSCSDELPFEEEGTEDTYTLLLSIDEPDRDTRADATGLPVKMRWCYGDKVILESSGGVSYEFTIDATGHEVGAPVEDRVAQFTHTGSVAGATNFTGTITYSPEGSSDVTPWGNTDTVKDYLLQSRNDDATHLKHIDELSAELRSYNLKVPKKPIVMHHAFGVIKVVLGGFIYPVSQGSVLWMQGFNALTGNTSSGLGLVLGNWTNHTVTTDGTRETLSGEPFMTVSDQKDPITTYALDDGRSLVAYVPFHTARNIGANKKLSVTVMDYFAKDIYVWSIKLPADMSCTAGNMYTLDLTRHEPDIAIEAEAKIKSMDWINMPLGYVRTKNLGAKHPWDIGDYHIFGLDYPIIPEQTYKNNPYPTPFYSYVEEEGQGILRLKDSFMSLESDLYITWASLLDGFGFNDATNYKPIGEIWRTVLSDDFNALQDCAGGWNLPRHCSKNNFERPTTPFCEVEMVDKNGNVTSDENQLLGGRMTIFRTGHALFFPASRMLKPSAFEEANGLPMIAGDAVAEYCSDYGIVCFPQEKMQTYNTGGEKGVYMMVDSYNMSGAPVRTLVPLYMAVPIRPIYEIYRHMPFDFIQAVNL